MRQVHERVQQHIRNNISCVFKLLLKWENKKNDIVSIIDVENLRLLEALYIKKLQPSDNSREEAKELNNFIVVALSPLLIVFYVSAYLSFTLCLS